LVEGGRDTAGVARRALTDDGFGLETAADRLWRGDGRDYYAVDLMPPSRCAPGPPRHPDADHQELPWLCTR
jgi:hypothetical protein